MGICVGVWDQNESVKRDLRNNISLSGPIFESFGLERPSANELAMLVELSSVEVILFSLHNRAEDLAALLRLVVGWPHLEVVYYSAGNQALERELPVAELFRFDVYDLKTVGSVEWLARAIPMLARRAQARRAVIQATLDLGPSLKPKPQGFGFLKVPLPTAESEFRTVYIESLLKHHKSIREAAKHAGISHTTLLHIMKKLDIVSPQHGKQKRRG